MLGIKGKCYHLPARSGSFKWRTLACLLNIFQWLSNEVLVPPRRQVCCRLTVLSALCLLNLNSATATQVSLLALAPSGSCYSLCTSITHYFLSFPQLYSGIVFLPRLPRRDRTYLLSHGSPYLHFTPVFSLAFIFLAQICSVIYLVFDLKEDRTFLFTILEV